MIVWTSVLILAVTANCVVHAMFFGKPADLEDFPHIAALICKNRDGDDYNCCSGVIVAQKYVLTTGYCVNPQSPHFEHSKSLVGVRVGSNSALGGGELHTVGDFTVRGNYDTLALIGVSKAFVWSDTLARAYLAAKKAPEPGWYQECKYLGWGAGNEEVSYTEDGMRLRYTTVAIQKKQSCAGDDELEGYREYDMFCTNTHAVDGTAAYSQDRGAPLLCDYVVYGLIQVIKDRSARFDCMGHIDVHLYIDWIDEILKVDF